MKTSGYKAKIAVILLLCFAVGLLGGCATEGQTGALKGAGVGALIGGLANMHGSWGASAVLGAGVGAGIGYLLGDEKDRERAARRRAVTREEMEPLAGTTWQVISVAPRQERPFKSIVSHFRNDGIVVTTKTNMDGRIERSTERYRIVGSTLILSQPDYVENAKFRIEGDRLFIDYGNGSTVLQRIS